MIHRLRQFAALPPLRRRLLLRSLAAVAAVRVGVTLLPFRSWRSGFAVRRSAPARRSARDIAWAVEVASPYVPRATCLVQALAAQFLLSREGHASRLRIGVAPSPTRLDAHAWLESDGEILLGGAAAPRYRALLTLE